MSSLLPDFILTVLVIQASYVFKLSLSEKTILNGAKLRILPKEVRRRQVILKTLS